MTRFTCTGSLASALAITLLGGCYNQIGRPEAPPTIQGERYSAAQRSADLKTYETAVAAQDTHAARLARDRMINRLRLDIEHVYRTYEHELFLDRATMNLGADLGELGLSLATTVVGGAGAKTALAAVLTATKGARLAIDHEFFRKKTVEIVISAMRGERKRKLAVIITKMRSFDVERYSWHEAEADLVEFYWAGTLHGGLLALAAKTGEEAQAAKREVRTVEVEPQLSVVTIRVAAMILNASPEGRKEVLKAWNVDAPPPTTDAEVTTRLIQRLQAKRADERELRVLEAEAKKALKPK